MKPEKGSVVSVWYTGEKSDCNLCYESVSILLLILIVLYCYFISSIPYYYTVILFLQIPQILATIVSILSFIGHLEDGTVFDSNVENSRKKDRKALKFKVGTGGHINRHILNVTLC